MACAGEALTCNQGQFDSLLEDIPVAPFDARRAKACGPLRAANRERSKDALDKPPSIVITALQKFNAIDFDQIHASMLLGDAP